MFAIYKRELKAYFRSFIGLLFIAVTLFFVSLYFTVNNLLYGYPYFSYAVGSIIFIFLITVPILSMRIMAEEKRSKTDQMILTAPVTVGDIIVGKYLALLTIFLIPTVVICAYPLIMSKFGTVPMAECYLAILGFFLYGAAAIAVGVLISALTESQVIAAVITFIVLFLGYMMPSITTLISSTGNLLTRVLGFFDMYTPFSEMLSGTLNLKSVAYYILLIGIVLFLAVQSVQKRRYSVSVKTLSLSAYSTGMIAVAIAIVVVVNLVISEMPSTWTSIDVTAEQLYSLTDQSKEYIKNMDEDVTIYCYVAESSRDTTLGQTLEYFDDMSDHITVEYVDPNVNPRFYTQYTDSSVSVNSLIVVSDKRSKVISYSNIYETSYDYDYTTGSYSSSTTGYDGEGQVLSALDYVLSDDMPKLYFTSGHGETSLSSTFTTGIAKENVDYATINLMDYDEVPEDASCLMINSPVSDFSSDDKDKIISYLEQGGNVILVTAYTDVDMPNFDALLDYMGLRQATGLVVEQNANNYYYTPYYILPTLSTGTYTSGLYGKYYVFAPYSQGIVVEDEDAEDMTYKTFLSTSDDAFAKADVNDLSDFDKSEEDEEGPFALGISAVKAIDDETDATMIVYSSQYLFTDDANSMVSGANLTLFTNTVSNFADHEVTVSVPVKDYEISYLTVTQAKVVLIGVITTLIIPVGCLVLGFVIWFRRRKR
jgi:ABC-2 type transport system permease protein